MLKTVNIYYLTVYVGQGSENSFAEWLWLRVSCGHSQDINWDYSHLKARLGLRDPLLKWFTNVPGKLCWLLTGGLSFLPHKSLPEGCLSVPMR